MKKKFVEAGKKLSAGLMLMCMLFGLAACGKSTTEVDNTVSIDAIHEAVKEAYGESYLPQMLLTEDEIKALYGVESEWYEEALAEVPMISAQVDTLIAIKATQGHVEDVQNALTAYKEYLENDSVQYPMNVPKIQASTVMTRGNYVFFIMLGTVDMEVMDQSEDAQVEAYKEMNQIAIDTIDGLLLKK